MAAGEASRQARPRFEWIAIAALGLIERSGLKGLTMRKLAAGLDTAASAIYNHVGSKESQELRPRLRLPIYRHRGVRCRILR